MCSSRVGIAVRSGVVRGTAPQRAERSEERAVRCQGATARHTRATRHKVVSSGHAPR